MVVIGIAVDAATQDQAIVHLRHVVSVVQMGESQGPAHLANEPARQIHRVVAWHADHLKPIAGLAARTGAISMPMPPQRWSNAPHRHLVGADDMVCISRRVNTGREVVVLDRAWAKLARPSYAPLAKAKGSLRALVIKLRVSARFVWARRYPPSPSRCWRRTVRRW